MKKYLLVLPMLLILTGCGAQQQPATNVLNSNEPTTPMNTNRPSVILKTSMGDITLELYNDKAPIAVKNFLDLAAKGYYDGILFHRVIEGFMIQVGDPNTKTDPKNWKIHGQGGPGYTIKDEFNDLPFIPGALGMAKTQEPNSGGSQFFIVSGEANFLNGQYTNFGQVTAGMDVVSAIEKVKTGAQDHPMEDVKILSITVK